MAHIYQWQKHRLVVFCQHHNLPIDDLKQLGEQELNKLVDYVYPWQVEKSENQYKDFRAKLVRVGAERGEMYMEMSSKGQFANTRMKYPDPEYCNKIQQDLDELYHERRETIPPAPQDKTSSTTSDPKQPSSKTAVPNAPGQLQSSGQAPRMPQPESSSKQLKRKSGQQHLGHGQPSLGGQLDNNIVPQQAPSSHQAGFTTMPSTLSGDRHTINAPLDDRRPQSNVFDDPGAQHSAQMQHRELMPAIPAPAINPGPASSAQPKREGAHVIDPEQARRQLQDRQRYSDPDAAEEFNGTRHRYNRSQMDLIDYGPPAPPAAPAPSLTFSSTSLRSHDSIKAEAHHPVNDGEDDQAGVEPVVKDRDVNSLGKGEQPKASGSATGQDPFAPHRAANRSSGTLTEDADSALSPSPIDPPMPQDSQRVRGEKKETKYKKDRKHDQTSAQTTTVTIPGTINTTDSDSSSGEDDNDKLVGTNDAAMQMLAKNMLTMNLEDIKMPPPPGYEPKDKAGKKFKKAKGKKKALDPGNPEAIDELVRDLGGVWISKGKGSTPEQQAEEMEKKNERKGKGKGKDKAQ